MTELTLISRSKGRNSRSKRWASSSSLRLAWMVSTLPGRTVTCTAQGSFWRRPANRQAQHDSRYAPLDWRRQELTKRKA